MEKLNQDVFDQLYQHYHNAILRYLYKFLHDYQAAEDLAQETFILVHKHLPEYKPTGKISSWIYKIAGNLAKNRLRNAKREKLSLFSTPVSSDEKIELGARQFLLPDKQDKQERTTDSCPESHRQYHTEIQGGLCAL